MKKVLFALVALTISLSAVAGVSYQQQKNNKQSSKTSSTLSSTLPKSAQQYIAKNYSHDKITKSTTGKSNYSATLNSGAILTFDSKGNITIVDSGRLGTVPSSIVPSKISEYVKLNYRSTSIIRIEFLSSGTKVTLKSGVVLEFDSRYRLVSKR